MGTKSRDVFVKNLHENMKKSEMTKKDISRYLNEPYSTVRDWCIGKSYPRIDKIDALAKLFGIPVSDLVAEKNAPGKISIELEPADAEILCDLLGEMNFYHVGCVVAMKNEYEEEDVEKANLAVGHAYRALFRALGRK